MITNENSDFAVNNDGFRVNALSSFTPSTAYTIYNGSTLVGRLYATTGGGITRIRIDALDGFDLDLLATGDMNLTSPEIALSANTRVEISGNNEVALLSNTRVRTNARLQLQTMNETQRNNLTGNLAGDVIYNTTTGRPNYHNGTNWVNF